MIDLTMIAIQHKFKCFIKKWKSRAKANKGLSFESAEVGRKWSLYAQGQKDEKTSLRKKFLASCKEMMRLRNKMHNIT